MGGRWADGLPSQALPSSLGAGSGQGERGHISHRNIVLVPLLETPQGKTKKTKEPFVAVLDQRCFHQMPQNILREPVLTCDFGKGMKKP